LYRFPGFSYHHELRHLANAGLDSLAVLRAATYDAAVALEQEANFGTIEPGKMADFVLLRADPLIDIDNVRQIVAIVHDGRLYDRAALDAIQRAVREEVADW
jgi:imidazolonepropionase-like amidohydrolase